MITGGENLVSFPPAFSNDSKKLLVCTGSTVSVFSSTTGLLVTELEGHTSLVTSIVVVPVETAAVRVACFCWTASLDGTIRYWDFSTPELVKTIELNHPIYSMVIPNVASSLSERKTGKQSKLHAFISVECFSKHTYQHKALHGQIRVCDLTHSRFVGGILTETRKPESITLSPSKEYLGIVNKRKIHIWRIPLRDFDFNSIKMIKLHHTKKFNSLAFHPTERIIAGGDTTGRILVWRGFGSKMFFGKKSRVAQGKDEDEADSTPTTWHWHASQVNFLSFSSDGAYLYSGGKEGVIVLWQLDSGIKKFKPRLGSPLLYFSESVDLSTCYVSCADNQIHVLKMPQMEITKTIAGIKLPFSYPEIYGPSSNGLAFDCSSGLIALRAENYCVQFFSLFDNLELFQVQIIQRNYQPNDDVTILILILTLSSDGSLMGTVDAQLPEEDIGGFTTLKFWSRVSKAEKGFDLSTVIHEPHRGAGISAVIFHPNNDIAVSTSFGGDFKVWVHSTSKQKSGWRCQSIGSYKKKPLTAAAFSADGSVLAIAAETVVTLWDPLTNALINIIGDTSTPITELCFVGSSGYFVTTCLGSEPKLTLWRLSNLSIHWSYKFAAESVSCIEDGSYFAVLMLLPNSENSNKNFQDGLILLFDVHQPVPSATWSVKKANGGRITFIQDREVAGVQAQSPMLAFINAHHEYIVFDPLNDQKCLNVRKTPKKNSSLGESDSFGYASIYGELPEFDLKKGKIPAISYTTSERPWETIFNGCSHVPLPLAKLCSAFLESLLEKRPNVSSVVE